MSSDSSSSTTLSETKSRIYLESLVTGSLVFSGIYFTQRHMAKSFKGMSPKVVLGSSIGFGLLAGYMIGSTKFEELEKAKRRMERQKQQ